MTRFLKLGLLAACGRAALAFLLAGLSPAWALAASVLMVTSSPVTPGKVQVLTKAAAQHGIRLEARFIEQLDKVDASLWAGRDLVFFDAPRDHLQEAITLKLAAALPALANSGKPVIWLHTSAPKWQRLPDELGRRLHAYYINGGKQNTGHFFAALSAQLAGRAWQQLPAPQVFPTTGIYHPKAPGLVFANTADYLKWYGAARNRPVIALAFHQQNIASEQTFVVDDFIARIERAGGVPLAFYSPVMGKTDLSAVLAAGGQVQAQALINTQITLNPEGRRAELQALGIPVIQAISYRKGSADDWRQDKVGLSLMDVPFYLSQPEFAGMHDTMVASAQDRSEQVLPIADQAQSVVNKAMALSRLARLNEADKRVAIMFWNYPPGEKNLGASYMNLPNSLSATLAALKGAGYTTEEIDPVTLTSQLQRLLRPYYRPSQLTQELEALLRDDLAELMPLSAYRQWLDKMPPAQRKAWSDAAGQPEQSRFLLNRGKEPQFVVVRLKLGNVVILPQPPRAEPVDASAYDKDKALYHSTTAAPTHSYMASYLWTRAQFKADALVHFGTHGSQEWLPGKERGLSVHDYPLLALGDLPVIYPYIVDNIGEALQTKRRGRAVNITHQTPPMAPAGLHRVLTELHDNLHAWIAQDEGAVKNQLRNQIINQVAQERIALDMGWSAERVGREFPAFIQALHDHLHELAQTVQPLGLHTFGKGAAEDGRLYTVMMMLGHPFWEAAETLATGSAQDADEAIVADYQRMKETAPYRLLQRHVAEGQDASKLPAKLQAFIEQGRRWHEDLRAEGETKGLLAALDGRYIPTSYGGDPLKNPDSLPTGRNLYGFDPSRIPTKAAWAAGREALDKLVAAHREKTGATPTKFTFSLWSVETMRHQGMLEAQALWAMGVEPVWDAGGRVTDVKLVPRKALGRPRIDVVLSATGLYRDHFPNTMKQLARAAELAAQAEGEADNAVAQNAQAITRQLTQQGWRADAATRAGQTRIFSGESGSYGTGLDDAALATDTWQTKEEGDRKMAELYLRKMQFAFGPREADWGKSGTDLAREAGAKPNAANVNLYAAHLKGTQAAVLARTSNVYGMLTTDDPFQYLGGIASAVRHLDGKAPVLLISNLRGSGSGKVEEAGQFLAKELATRNFHPGHIQGLMKEGYAGTLQVLDGINNFTGWTTVSREIVRDDQWQQFVEVYVRDKHQIGVRRWMEKENPHAMAQVMERMLEMARQGYWKTDEGTLDELKSAYRELAQRHDVRTDNRALQQFAGLPGYGLSQPAGAPAPLDSAAAQTLPRAATPPAAPPAQRPPDAPTETPAETPAEPEPTIRGMQLEQVIQQPVVQALSGLVAAALGLLLLAPAVGAWRQWRRA